MDLVFGRSSGIASGDVLVTYEVPGFCIVKDLKRSSLEGPVLRPAISARLPKPPRTWEAKPWPKLDATLERVGGAAPASSEPMNLLAMAVAMSGAASVRADDMISLFPVKLVPTFDIRLCIR